jgi:hypothetical protein
MITLSDEQFEKYFRMVDDANEHRKIAKRKQYEAEEYLNKQIALHRVEEMSEDDKRSSNNTRF